MFEYILHPLLVYSLSIMFGVLILAAAIPYVARIRHPKQKPLAAYLIFISAFVVSASIFFNLLAWLAYKLDLGGALSKPAPAVLFLVLVFIPAIILARWLARKPPWQPMCTDKQPD